ncbi:MAG: hypothetical protein M1818_005910 [Claussenomyces sp. TS43310]|nr:MAG: hypothetical protein M1818_005910 [Claussenomyces sp. TS43310]
MASSRKTYGDYTVCLLCSLAVERAAVVAMLDEEHPRLRALERDDNEYVLGRIGVHNVVVACLPAEMAGKNLMATVVKDIQRSFHVEFGVMIGIGGGVWSRKRDVRLGDVVVSQPEGLHGGVVQWDFGTMEKGGGFWRTRSLNSPPRLLLDAVQTLRVKHWMEGDRILDNVATMLRRKPFMIDKFSHQGAEQDRLFQASSEYNGQEICHDCNVEKTVRRATRKTSAPKIHYGNIASGNKVMADGKARDRIAKTEGVICFDTEAAGLMDAFPCVVIRGISNYADSHENERWQPYAAATAAAFAKELLGVLDKQEAKKSNHARESTSVKVISHAKLCASVHPLGMSELIGVNLLVSPMSCAIDVNSVKSTGSHALVYGQLKNYQREFLSSICGIGYAWSNCKNKVVDFFG